MWFVMLVFLFDHKDGGLPASLLETLGSKGVVQVNGKNIEKNSHCILKSGDEVIFSSSGKHAYVSFTLLYKFSLLHNHLNFKKYHYMFFNSLINSRFFNYLQMKMHAPPFLKLRMLWLKKLT